MLSFGDNNVHYLVVILFKKSKYPDNGVQCLQKMMRRIMNTCYILIGKEEKYDKHSLHTHIQGKCSTSA